MPVQKCSPAVCNLEKLMQQSFALGNILLNLDMYERWGGAGDATMNAELEKAADYAQQNDQLRKEIEARAKQLCEQDRQAWAEAHIALLQDFLNRSELSEQDTSTAIFVAREEISGWQKVRAGQAHTVQRNVFYINYDQNLYAAYFNIQK